MASEMHTRLVEVVHAEIHQQELGEINKQLLEAVDIWDIIGVLHSTFGHETGEHVERLFTRYVKAVEQSLT